MKLDVNTDSAIKLTAKLEKLHKSAFPSAVRNTLNEVAFNAKKNVPKMANDNFTIRQKGMFNAMTSVEKAKGFNVNSMRSVVGINGSKNSKLAEGLSKQETGGTINGKKMIAHDMGRVSNSSDKKVKAKNLGKRLGRIGTSKNRVQGSKYFRIKKGSKETVFENTGKNRLTPIYNIRTTNKSRVIAKPFIHPSAVLASKQMESIYKKQADFQIKKHMR